MTTEIRICPRCLVGTDDDNDGNCAVCAKLTASQATLLSARFSAQVNRAVKIARDTAFEEVLVLLNKIATASVYQTVRNYKRRFPNHGDFVVEREQLCNQQITVPATFEGPVVEYLEMIRGGRGNF